jgi:phenylacetyl-CoA:acceptor oxidoreductase subunit 1
MAERWGMVVDLNRCVGCQTCTVACKHFNDTGPGVQWRQVLDVETGRYPDVERLFLVVGCQHCAEPPCVPVCPTGATRQRADGLVTMDYALCIGCASCAVACPYQARTIVHEPGWYFGEATEQERHATHPERRGVAQKCTFCVDKVDEAKARGLTPGVDLEVTPACAASCIAEAIHFGDLNDASSNVSRLARDNPSFQMHAELGTDPQIRYLYQTPAVPGRDPAPEDTGDEASADPTSPLVGRRQPFWDMRAAINFILGGLSSGFAVVAYLAYVLGALPGAALPRLYLIAAALMAVGLFFVFLKLGRKLRFLYVLRRPQSSWMSRETWAVAAFYPAVLADLMWPQAALHLLVAVAAAAFLYCQARILQASKGIPAWRVALMPWMLVATGLYEGAAVLIMTQMAFWGAVPEARQVAAAAAVLAVVNAGLWLRFVSGAKDAGVGPLSRRVLGALTPWLVGIGHALPFVIYVLTLTPFVPPEVVVGLGAAAAVAGGVLWKATVVIRACHQQGFALAKLPQRGSGVRAAPPLVESAVAQLRAAQ